MSLKMNWKATVILTVIYALAAMAGFIFIRDRTALQVYLFVLFGILFIGGNIWSRRRA
jgi:hypothetical protein